ncbi:MAG: hypothetical protein LBU32_19000 [Clostridiales bacterium]|nr:hypothetical protein [Clostridiales bacterium]
MAKTRDIAKGKLFGRLAGGLMLCAIMACVVFLTQTIRIKESAMNAYINGNAQEKESLKKLIARSVLINSGKWSTWGRPERLSVDVRLERIKGRQKDALVIVNGGKGKILAAVYEKNSGFYSFSGLVGIFNELKDIQVMPMKDETSGVIVARERIDNPKGSEESIYIRAYIWDNGGFRTALDLRESYKAYHNELWDQNKPANKSIWIKVSGRSDIIWENADSPIIHVLVHQNYSLSRSANQETEPPESDFELIRNRDILEEYVWSGKWMHFILFEGFDIQNGEPVAVIEDLSGGPLGLFEQYSEANNKYRVKYLDGTVSTVEKERVKPGIQIKNTRVVSNGAEQEAEA